jgi:hypothetical protein
LPKGNRQQATGNRQQATGNRQQATGNRQQATGNYTHLLTNRVNQLTALHFSFFAATSRLTKTVLAYIPSLRVLSKGHLSEGQKTA